jgi:histidinol-phosphate/aromatic aminotransferase/cobyric acid decarboxylase-like protein
VKASLNPLLPRLSAYLQEKANAQREAAMRSGKPVHDFGIGDPREPTPEFIREALRKAVPEVSQYPSIAGLPALRKAIAGYLQRRFALEVDPESEVLPCAGAKEALFHLPLTALNPARPICWYPDPGYPVYERAILFSGGTPRVVPLRAERASFPIWIRYFQRNGSALRSISIAIPTIPPARGRRAAITRSWRRWRASTGFSSSATSLMSICTSAPLRTAPCRSRAKTSSSSIR